MLPLKLTGFFVLLGQKKNGEFPHSFFKPYSFKHNFYGCFITRMVLIP